MFLIMNGPTTHSTSSPPFPTRHVNQQQNNRIHVVAEREVPRVGQADRPNLRFLQEGKRFPHRQHFTRDSSGVQHVEQVVAEEQKPGGHLETQELDKVEHVARHLHKGPAVRHILEIRSVPEDHEANRPRLLRSRAEIRISPDKHHTREN